MRGQAGSTGGANRVRTGRPSQRPNAKGSSASGKGYKTAGQTDVKRGYGGEKYPTQKQVAKKAAAKKKK